jgi:anti-repressor protein
MNIIPFQFGESQIRTVFQFGEPWFVASDVARVLGYTNPQKAVRDHCKGVNETFIPSEGGAQTANVIPERDVYRLIMRSKLPAAEKFEEWVVGEVLPAIRKTGGYLLPQSLPAALRALADAEEQKAQLAIANAEMQPKVEYFDCAMTSKKGLLIRDVAKLLHDAVPGGMGEHRLFEWLRKNRWLFLTPDKQNRPYQDKVDAGYLVTNEYPVATNNHGTLNKITVRITPKGRFALHRALLKEQEQNEKEAA